MSQGCSQQARYDPEDSIGELNFSRHTQHVAHGSDCGPDTLEISGANTIGNGEDTNQGAI